MKVGAAHRRQEPPSRHKEAASRLVAWLWDGPQGRASPEPLGTRELGGERHDLSAAELPVSVWALSCPQSCHVNGLL